MGLESVPVRFLLGDGTPGQLSCPNSVTLLPQSPLTEAEYSALRRHHKDAECHRTTLAGTNKSELALLVLFQKWEMRGAQARDSQPYGQPRCTLKLVGSW